MLAALLSLVCLSRLTELVRCFFTLFDMSKRKTPRTGSKNFKITPRARLVNDVSGQFTANLYDKAVLKRVHSYLSKKNRNKLPERECCPVEESSDGRIDQQVKLRCRQLTTVVKELRKALLRQDWDEATTLAMILCHPGLKYYTSILIRTCFILLCNHPKSSLDLVQNFIRELTGYILEEDVNKFIKVLFALRKSGVEPLQSGKYTRKTGDYKVIKDAEFDGL